MSLALDLARAAIRALGWTHDPATLATLRRKGDWSDHVTADDLHRAEQMRREWPAVSMVLGVALIGGAASIGWRLLGVAT